MAVKAPKKIPVYEFHPLASRYPLMPDAELAIMADDMAVDGFDPRFPIVLHEGKILEGRNRYLACKIAGVCPCFITLPKNVDPARFQRIANENRRHLLPEILSQLRSERVERVAEKRAEGKSLRTIAKEENVSETQVRRDLEDSGAPPGAPEPKLNGVLGKDGKTYPPKKPPTGKILCGRCQRIGKPVEDCAACADLRSTKKPALIIEDDDEDEEPVEETIEEEIKRVNGVLESWCRGLMKYAETMPEDAWLTDMGRREGAMQKIKNAADGIRSAKCHSECPKCKSDGCKKCHDTGRMTKYALEQMGAV